MSTSSNSAEEERSTHSPTNSDSIVYVEPYADDDHEPAGLIDGHDEVIHLSSARPAAGVALIEPGAGAGEQQAQKPAISSTATSVKSLPRSHDHPTGAKEHETSNEPPLPANDKNFDKIPKLFQRLSEERLLANGSIHFENVLKNIVLDLSNVLVLKLILWVKNIIHNMCRIYPEAELLDVLRFVDEVFGNSPVKVASIIDHPPAATPILATPAPQNPDDASSSLLSSFPTASEFSHAEQEMLHQILGTKATAAAPLPPFNPRSAASPPAQTSKIASLVNYAKLSHMDLFNAVCKDIGSTQDRVKFLQKSEGVIEKLRTESNTMQIEAMIDLLKGESASLLKDDKFERIRRASIDSVANTIVMAKQVWKQDLIMRSALEDMHHQSSTWPMIDYVFLPKNIVAMRVYLGGDWNAKDLQLFHDTNTAIISFEGRYAARIVIPLPCEIVPNSLKAKFENCVLDMTAIRG